MALSDRLSELAQRTKQAEDRARAASTEAKEELRARVDQASEAARRTADELTQRAGAAEAKASDWWTQVQSDWAMHVKTVRDSLAAKKAERDVRESQYEADVAAADAESAIDFAFAAVEEAEYAVLDSILAQKEADDISAGR